MNQNNQGVDESQGVSSSEEWTVEKVEKFLTRDLKGAISMLNALHSDPDLLKHLAAFMYGRLLNSQRKEGDNG